MVKVRVRLGPMRRRCKCTMRQANSSHSNPHTGLIELTFGLELLEQWLGLGLRLGVG